MRNRLANIFPFLFGGTFIEGNRPKPTTNRSKSFPFLFGGTFIEGCPIWLKRRLAENFPSFSEGLSLRQTTDTTHTMRDEGDFPSFSEGLSLRLHLLSDHGFPCREDFPSFSEGLSLRPGHRHPGPDPPYQFPFLFGGTFIEALFQRPVGFSRISISLPFRRDFH